MKKLIHKLRASDIRKITSFAVLAGISIFLLVDALHISPAYGQSCSYVLVANPNNVWLAQPENWIDYAGGNCVVWNDCAGACTGGNTSGCSARYCPSQHYGYYQYWSCQQVCSCAANQGQSCTSASNSCGQVNTGTIQCDGSCSASTPANPAYLGQSCTSASNSCGQTNSGTLNCSDACSASTPANPWYLGVGCTSAPNSCGMTNSGTYDCNANCSASTPSNALCPSCVAYQGQSCTSAANSCGMANTGTYQCNGSCSASTPPNSACPVCSANQGQSCTSAPNICGQKNSGTIQCNGSCSASTPGVGAVSIGSFIASPNLLPSGGSSTLTLAASNVQTSCIIRDQLGNLIGTYTPSSCGVSASVSVGPITSQAVYTATCDGTTAKTVVVNVNGKYVNF